MLRSIPRPYYSIRIYYYIYGSNQKDVPFYESRAVRRCSSRFVTARAPPRTSASCWRANGGARSPCAARCCSVASDAGRGCTGWPTTISRPCRKPLARYRRQAFRERRNRPGRPEAVRARVYQCDRFVQRTDATVAGRSSESSLNNCAISSRYGWNGLPISSGSLPSMAMESQLMM